MSKDTSPELERAIQTLHPPYRCGAWCDYPAGCSAPPERSAVESTAVRTEQDHQRNEDFGRFGDATTPGFFKSEAELAREIAEPAATQFATQVCHHPYDGGYICGRRSGSHDDDALCHPFTTGQVELAQPTESSFHAQALTVISRHTAKADVDEAFVNDIARELEMASVANERRALTDEMLVCAYDYAVLEPTKCIGVRYYYIPGEPSDSERLFCDEQCVVAKYQAEISATQPPIAPDTQIISQITNLASAMQFKLDKNARKPGWQTYDENGVRVWNGSMLAFLKGRLVEEVEELFAEVPDGDRESIRFEAADVANLAMMIADVCGALSSQTADAPGEQAAPVAEEAYLRHGTSAGEYQKPAAEGEAVKAALLPCPFCGGPAKRIHDPGVFYAVGCDGTCNELISFSGDTDAEVTALWNRRASIDPASLSAERCAEVLTEIEYEGYGWMPDSLGVRSEGNVWLRLNDARIICAFYLEHGLVREGEAK